MNNPAWWVGITYLLYIIFWDGMIFGSTIYVVFWMHQSPLWFVGAIFLGMVGFQPHHWNRLWTGREPE